MNRGLLAPALPFGCMFQSSVAKLPFAATKTIIKAIIRFNSGLNIKAITTAAAPPPNTRFVVQKSMPMNHAFSQGRFMWVYGMPPVGPTKALRDGSWYAGQFKDGVADV